MKLNYLKNLKSINDTQIRAAVYQKLFRKYSTATDVSVLEEVGVRHGAARVDFLVVNGMLHGFELKSDRDTLIRLQNQIPIYSSVLDRVTLIVGYRLADDALKIIPDWWGVKLVSLGKRGALHFHDAKTAKNNPSIKIEALAQLLWRNQALQVLEELGAATGMRSKTRKEIYARLADCGDLNLIRTKVCYFLHQRKNSESAERQM